MQKKRNIIDEKNENDELFNLNDDAELDEEIEIVEDMENDVEIEEEKTEDTEFDIMFKGTANKHKLEGTHALKRDTIFMGKLEDVTDQHDTSTQEYDTDNYNIERGSQYEKESRHYSDYFYEKSLTKDIYDILNEKTEIDFVQNRRKPNKQTFNKYYEMCIEDLSMKYTKSEIFVELSYYFTDNIFNMFKLLNKKNATGIILELKEKGYLSNIGNINFI